MLSKYELVKELSSGSFGKIYQGVHKRNKQQVAINVEKKEEHSSLKHEARVYHYLKSVKGIPHIIWYGTDKVNNYIILPLLGENIRDVYEENNMPKEILETWGKSMCEILKQVHLLEIVHGDIKPENFLFDIQQKNIYLIDFGFARKFNTEPKKLQSPAGTPSYMSRSCHLSLEPGYLDDVESLFFLLMSLYYTKLPWQNKIVDHVNLVRQKQLLMDAPDYVPEMFHNLMEIIESGKRDCFPEYNLFI